MVRVVGIEPTLLSELDFEGSRAYQTHVNMASPGRSSTLPARLTAPIRHLFRWTDRPMCTPQPDIPHRVHVKTSSFWIYRLLFSQSRWKEMDHDGSGERAN